MCCNLIFHTWMIEFSWKYLWVICSSSIVVVEAARSKRNSQFNNFSPWKWSPIFLFLDGIFFFQFLIQQLLFSRIDFFFVSHHLKQFKLKFFLILYHESGNRPFCLVRDLMMGKSKFRLQKSLVISRWWILENSFWYDFNIFFLLFRWKCVCNIKNCKKVRTSFYFLYLKKSNIFCFFASVDVTRYLGGNFC